MQSQTIFCHHILVFGPLYPLQLPHTLPSGNYHTVACVYEFQFYAPHMSEIIWFLAFSDWLISLSIIVSRSIHVVASGRISSILFFLKILFFVFTEREREGETEGGKHQCVVASCVPPTRNWPATQACALIGNRTSDPLVHRPALNPLSYTRQGSSFLITNIL